MDIRELLEAGSQPVPELQTDKLEQMIERAVAYPQLKKPANQNDRWLRQLMATAAAIVVLIAAGVHFYPSPIAPPAQVTEDAYDDMTDLMLYETLNDLS